MSSTQGSSSQSLRLQGPLGPLRRTQESGGDLQYSVVKTVLENHCCLDQPVGSNFAFPSSMVRNTHYPKRHLRTHRTLNYHTSTSLSRCREVSEQGIIASGAN